MAYKKVEHFEDKITSQLTENIREQLALLGEDPDREGIVKRRNVLLNPCSS
jgi:GTP cyclohydrolase I